MMSDPIADELIALNQRLVESIAAGDWATYEQLCDPSLTAFEPEARGQLVEGMDFHRFYFDRGGVPGHHNTTISAPHVRLLGDVAVVSYIRLIQHVSSDGRFVTSRFEETRVWQKRPEGWRHVHFHRTNTA